MAMMTRMGLCVAFTVLLLGPGAMAAPTPAARLSAGQVSGEPGQAGLVLAIDLTSDPGVEVAALGFDLHYDPAGLIIQDTTAGQAALAAGKQVASSNPAQGTLRVIVYGLNQNAISDGGVVKVTFDIHSEAPPGVLPLTFSDASAASPGASLVALNTLSGSVTVESLTTFVDVPRDHWAYEFIEVLYQNGYVAGCNADPLMYCPEKIMNRAESAVFVVRGVHGAEFIPPQPTEPIFDDVPVWEWFADWAAQLWTDGYTAGCGLEPLGYCPFEEHTRAEGGVFFLRMMNGKDYVPPEPVGLFIDVPLTAWYADWVEAAYNAGLIPACETAPELRFCPGDPLDRAMAAYMMVQAKGLSIH
jgi:hypothetical protein